MSEKLPMANGGGSAPKQPGAGGPATGSAAAPGTPGAASAPTPAGRPRASSPRLIATLAVAGAVAGFFIVLVHQWSQPRIQAYQAMVLQEAVQEVLGGPDHTETWFLHEGAFTPAPPAGADTSAMDRIYLGFAEDGSPMGVAAAAGEPGFQDIIRLIFGYDPGASTVLGMKVLESKETPGLGDKIEKDSSFVAEFAGVEAPLVGVKAGKATGADDEVDMITGATISSEAIIRIINNRVTALEEPLARLWREGATPASRGQAAGTAVGQAAAAQAPTASERTTPPATTPPTPAGGGTP